MYPFRLRPGGGGGELLACFRKLQVELLHPPSPPAGDLAAEATEAEDAAAAERVARVGASAAVGGSVTGGRGGRERGDMEVLLGTCQCLGLRWVGKGGGSGGGARGKGTA